MTDGPRRSPSGELRAQGVTFEAINQCQRDVRVYVSEGIAKQRAIGDTPGLDGLVISDKAAAALEERLARDGLRDVICDCFLRLQADLQKGPKAPIPTSPDATPPRPLKRIPTQR